MCLSLSKISSAGHGCLVNAQICVHISYLHMTFTHHTKWTNITSNDSESKISGLCGIRRYLKNLISLKTLMSLSLWMNWQRRMRLNGKSQDLETKLLQVLLFNVCFAWQNSLTEINDSRKCMFLTWNVCQSLILCFLLAEYFEPIKINIQSGQSCFQI